MKKTLGQLSRRYHKEDNDDPSVIVCELKEILKTFDPTLKDAKKCLSMMANMSVGDVDFMEEIVGFGKNHDLMTEQIYTAAIRGLCENDEDIKASAVLADMMDSEIHPHVRSFLPFYQKPLVGGLYWELYGALQATGLVPTRELFSLLIGRYPEKEPPGILLNTIWWAGQHCNHLDDVVTELKGGKISHVSDAGICDECSGQLNPIELTEKQRTLMLKSVFPEARPDLPPIGIARWLQTRDYSIVIDGANVAHYNNSPFDVRKVVNLVNKLVGSELFKGKRILVVFAMCRRKAVRKLEKMWKNVDVFYSKIGTNDDLSWLYAAISNPECLCITNDQMRDHVYYKFTEVVGRNVIDLWMERQVVSFRIFVQKVKNRVNVQIEVDLPLPYSVRPTLGAMVPVPIPTDEGHQFLNRKLAVHIPLKDGSWYCWGNAENKPIQFDTEAEMSIEFHNQLMKMDLDGL